VKTGIIAVITPGYLGEPLHNAPFFSSLLDGIELGADRADLDIYLARPRQSRGVPLLIQDRGVDGVICIQPNAAITAICSTLNLAAVTLFDHGENIHGIEPDQQDGMRKAVKYLVELGHRRIAYLGQELTFSSSIDRFEGYRQGLREQDIEEDASLCEATLTTITFAADGLDRLLSRQPSFSALVCYNDAIAMSAVRRLQEHGFRVPQDVNVVGFDDISTQYNFAPALTSIHFDGTAMGYRAVEMLSELAADMPKAPTQWRHELFPVELRVRESTAPKVAIKS